MPMLFKTYSHGNLPIYSPKSTLSNTSLLQTNKDFNIQAINQYLTDIQKTFEQFKFRETSQENIEKLNKLRRLLDIVHKFTVQQSKNHYYSGSKQNVLTFTPTKNSQKVDFGTQFSFDFKPIYPSQKEQQGKIMRELSKNQSFVEIVEKNSQTREDLPFQKVLDLATRSLNLSIHALNLKSIQESTFEQNPKSKLENSEKILLKINSDVSLAIDSRKQLYSQLTKIKKEIKDLNKKSKHHNDKQNMFGVNGTKKISIQKNDILRRRLFEASEQDTCKISATIYRESNLKVQKLEKLYKQTKEIYRQYEQSLSHLIKKSQK